MKKKILFIGLNFYGYDEAIIEELKNRNCEVDFFSGLTPKTSKRRVALRLGLKSVVNNIGEHYKETIIKEIKSDYNIVFIIGGVETSESFLLKIKEKNPNAFYILYLWDSLERIPNIKPVTKYFDKIFSFDRLDCLNLSDFLFLPLFYRNEYRREKPNYDSVDIYHLGSIHSDRVRLIKLLDSECKVNDITVNFKIRVGKVTYLMHRIFGGELKGAEPFLIFKDWSHQKNIAFMDKSNAVLDIHHPTQSGLTMRTLELLAMQKKIITTNEDIINYDFYCPENILVINRFEPIINKDFFKKDYLPVKKEIREKYSIGNWVNTIFFS